MTTQIQCCRCDDSCPIHHAPVSVNAEMLAALKRIVDGGCPAFAEEQVRAAIAKAEGV